MNFSRIKHEGWLYWLAFLIALGLRLIQLGANPLVDSESQLALQALHIARGQEALLGPQPAYILFTSVLFLITESTNFMARFLPAIVGSLLVFTPRYFEDKLKPVPALVLAFLFAFDPGLTALSRQAGGTILAVTFLFFAWGMWRNGRSVPAGIFAGLALLSGPSIWSGLLTLGLAFLFLREKSDQTHQPEQAERRTLVIVLIATILLAGTLFFTTANGLSALFNSLPAYLSGWTSFSVFTPGRMLIAFVGYEPLGIFLAVFTLVRGLRGKSVRVQRLAVWLGVSLLIAIFYRQTSELVWVIIPLLALAADELSHSFSIYPEERAETGLISFLMLITLILAGLNVSYIGLGPGALTPITIPVLGFNLQYPDFHIVRFYGAIFLLLCIIAFSLVLSLRSARISTTWAFSLFLGVYAFAAAWGASGQRTPNGIELWSPDQAPIQADLVMSSVDDISLFSLGHIESQPVTVIGIDSPSLEWALRDYDVEVVSVLDPLNAPPIIITPLMNELGLPSAYRGQDFIWRQPPSWNNVQRSDWVRWLVYRQLPRETETIILWARDDLFPDARENTQP